MRLLTTRLLSIGLLLISTTALPAQTSVQNSASGAFRFIENKGQVGDQYHHPRPDILYVASDNHLSFHFKENGISYQFSKADALANFSLKQEIHRSKQSVTPSPTGSIQFYRLDISWPNANPHPQLMASGKLDGFENYYNEVAPQGALEVSSFHTLRYKNLYNGIDLKLYEKNGHLKYDYEVKAGADYSQIMLDINGASSLKINSKGQLIVETPLGTLAEEAPFVFQNGKVLKANWLIKGQNVSFQIQGVNPNQAFTIDPLVRLWGTYYGGSQDDYLGYTCVDINNNVYMSGSTRSSTGITIATVGSHQSTYGGNGTGTFPGDAFLVKFNSAGVRQWATYYGGSGSDFANNCVADANGDVYFVGGSNTTNTAVICTPGCHQSTLAGGTSIGDGIIVKLNSAGARLWATYYGDSDNDWCYGVSVDQNGEVFVCGGSLYSSNSTLATPGSQQPQHAGVSGNVDAYLAKFTSTGIRIWGTYYGGPDYENGTYCKNDILGNVYLIGSSTSTVSGVISTPGSHQVNFGGGTGAGDVYLAKFDGAGNRIWGTYYGGNGDEFPFNVEVDKNGNTYFAGQTSSATGTAIASSNGFQPAFGGGATDDFLAKFNSAGVRQWGTYYGGTGNEYWGYCAIDSYSNTYLCGSSSTNSGTAVATACAYQPVYGGGTYDAFLTKFDITGSRLWGTYYGGGGNEGMPTIDYGPSVEVDGANNVYLGGITTVASNSLIIAGTGGHQPGYGGGNTDAFLVKFNGCIPAAPTATNLQVCKGTKTTLSTPQTCGLKWYADSLGTNLLASGPVFSLNPIYTDSTFWIEDVSCGIGSPRAPAHVTVLPVPNVNMVATPSVLCKGETSTLTASGAPSYSWTNFTSTASTVAFTPSVTNAYGLIGFGSNGCEGTATVAVIVNECTGLQEARAEGLLVEVYPNPNQGSVTILSKSDLQLDVVNLLGQIVLSFDVKANTVQTFNLGDLPNGVYTLQSKTVVLKKLVLTK